MKNRLYLRALEPEDYQVSYMWRNDPDISEMVGGHKYFVSKENEKRWVERNVIGTEDRIVLAICLIENDKYIGNVNIQEIDWINRTAHVPIIIGDKNEWGKGYATEARFLALKFCFEERNLNRIYALVLEYNIPSLKMLEKCGYKKEGVLRNSIYKSGVYHNQIIMGLLKEDFDEAYEEYCKKQND